MRSSSPLLPVRLRDFLFPETILKRTGAGENPMVVQSHRRARRLWRKAFILFFDVLFVVVMWRLLKAGTGLPFFDYQITSSWPPAVSTRLVRILTGIHVLLAFAFIRYQMVAYDRSLHVKSLGQGQLEQLLLTSLNREELFLHHMLLFGLRCRLLVVFFIAFAAFFIPAALTDWIWVRLDFYHPALLLLNLVLLSWCAASIQYVLEWRLFAGRRFPAAQRIVSWLLSLVLAAVLFSLSLLIFDWRQGRWDRIGFSPFVLTAVLFGSMAWVAWRAGMATYRGALELLWDRVAGSDLDHRPQPPRTVWSVLLGRGGHTEETRKLARETIWKGMLRHIGDAVLCAAALSAGYIFGEKVLPSEFTEWNPYVLINAYAALFGAAPPAWLKIQHFVLPAGIIVVAMWAYAAGAAVAALPAESKRRLGRIFPHAFASLACLACLAMTAATMGREGFYDIWGAILDMDALVRLQLPWTLLGLLDLAVRYALWMAIWTILACRAAMRPRGHGLSGLLILAGALGGLGALIQIFALNELYWYDEAAIEIWSDVFRLMVVLAVLWWANRSIQHARQALAVPAPSPPARCSSSSQPLPCAAPKA